MCDVCLGCLGAGVYHGGCANWSRCSLRRFQGEGVDVDKRMLEGRKAGGNVFEEEDSVHDWFGAPFPF